ncbi:MAG: hypothetical protein D6796_10470 [Caldilineae bacterium]|nr:MAG: hypothetical protein D6796_10470 [Caldilineae bacterium]
MNDKQRARLDAHAIKAHLLLAEASAEGEVEEKKEYVLGYTGADLPTYNFFIPLSLAGLTDETLADASAFFRSRGVMYAVSLEEHRVPDGTEYLSTRRYQPLPPQPIMAREGLPTETASHAELTVRRVATIPEMTAFYTVLESVFDYTADELMLLFPSTQLKHPHISHFVGYLPDSRPVTAGTAVYADGVVSVWNLSTLDNFRRRGFAVALQNHILADAARQGCDLSLVYATPMGFSLTNRLGYTLYAMRQWFLPQEIG